MKHAIIIILVGLLTVLSSCTKGLKGVKVESEKDKNLYVLGSKFGTGLNSLELTDEEALVLARGFMDASLNQKIEGIDDATRAQKVQEFLAARKDTAKKDTLKQGKEFIDNFIKNGGKKTASGLAYQILKEGETGTRPGPKDTVEIHFHALLTDGTVFASTRGPNKPMRYPLDKIIQGWSEGIQLVGPGGQIKLVIPPELGYGDNGSPPKVPGGATLVMEVELLSVIKAKSQ